MTTTNQNMDKLETQVEELLSMCSKLTVENKNLKTKVTDLNTEKSTLIEQKDKARSHIEAMITRLKSLEHNAGAGS